MFTFPNRTMFKHLNPHSDVFNGLIHRWEFEESSGATVADSVGSIDGTVDIGSISRPTGRIGVRAGGFNNDSCDLGAPAALRRTTNFSWSFWFNPSSAPEGAALIHGGQASGPWNNFNIQFTGDSSNRIQAQFAAAGNVNSILYTSSNGGADIPRNTWSLITVTHSPTKASIYVDGGIRGNINNPPSVLYDLTYYRVAFGSRRYNGGLSGISDLRLNGSMDDIRYYNRALTEEEVYGMYHHFNHPPA